MTGPKWLLLALTGPLLLSSGPVSAGTIEEVMATYQQFAEAQNARDLDRVGGFFSVDPNFLWVSDGQSFWGRERVLDRMGSFQKAEHWRVVSDLDAARVIEVAEGTSLLHMPLVLEIGPVAAPGQIGFLVSILFRRDGEEWVIAALLTTGEKPVAQ